MNSTTARRDNLCADPLSAFFCMYFDRICRANLACHHDQITQTHVNNGSIAHARAAHMYLGDDDLDALGATRHGANEIKRVAVVDPN